MTFLDSSWFYNVDNTFWFVIIVLALIFFHELCHWIFAKYYKVNEGFISPLEFKCFLIGLQVKCKPTTIKESLIISNAGILIPSIVCIGLFFLTGLIGFAYLSLVNMVLSIFDILNSTIYTFIIRKHSFNNPKRDAGSFAMNFNIDYLEENNRWIKYVEGFK